MKKARIFRWERFRDDDRGSMAVELVMVVPILMWIVLSTYVYFDTFRNEANAHRAALTIADMFSREEDAIDSAYLNGARSLLQTLTLDDDNPDFRVTVYRYQESDDTYRRIWSRTRGVATGLDDGDLADLKLAARLPVMADGDRSILLETFTEYTPPFNTGIRSLTNFFQSSGGSPREDLDTVNFATFTVIRPRFELTLCWDRAPPDNDLC